MHGRLRKSRKTFQTVAGGRRSPHQCRSPWRQGLASPQRSNNTLPKTDISLSSEAAFTHEADAPERVYKRSANAAPGGLGRLPGATQRADVLFSARCADPAPKSTLIWMRPRRGTAESPKPGSGRHEPPQERETTNRTRVWKPECILAGILRRCEIASDVNYRADCLFKLTRKKASPVDLQLFWAQIR